MSDTDFDGFEIEDAMEQDKSEDFGSLVYVWLFPLYLIRRVLFVFVSLMLVFLFYLCSVADFEFSYELDERDVWDWDIVPSYRPRIERRD